MKEEIIVSSLDEKDEEEREEQKEKQWINYSCPPFDESNSLIHTFLDASSDLAEYLLNIKRGGEINIHVILEFHIP